MQGRSISKALAIVALVAIAASGCKDDKKPAPPAMLTGRFGVEAGGRCNHGVTGVRVVEEAGGTRSAKLGADCTFRIEVTPRTYFYLQVLDGADKPMAFVAWPDPTKWNDGRTGQLTSFFYLGAKGFHLGQVGFSTSFPPQARSVGELKLVGVNGAYATPRFYPSLVSSADDGIPDSSRAGFHVGGDLAGNTTPVPTPANPTCALPTTGLLHGRIQSMLFQPIGDRLTAEEHAAMTADPSKVPAGQVLAADGLTRGPVVQRGLWITYGNLDNPAHAAMADTNGNFAIDAAAIPKGVAFAKVYRDLADERPLYYLPLCLLKTNAAEVAADTSLIDYRGFPDPCSMNSSEPAPSCHNTASDEEHAAIERSVVGRADAGALGTKAVSGGHVHPQTHGGIHAHTHQHCGDANNVTCCLDYAPVKGGDKGRPHDTTGKLLAYSGSICSQYVDAGCCLNETGRLVEQAETAAAIIAGWVIDGALPFVPDGTTDKLLPNRVSCLQNHRLRNCQNINLGPDGLVLSASRKVRDDASSTFIAAPGGIPPVPEAITVACGSTTPIYYRNNTCQNTDNIVNVTRCGKLSVEGPRIDHEFGQGPPAGPGRTSRVNLVNRDLTFEAPNQPCRADIITSAFGMTRLLSISVVCSGTPPPPPPPDSGTQSRAAVASAIRAESTAVNDTTYTLNISNPAHHALTVTWTGPECGTFSQPDSGATTTVNPQKRIGFWSHPHPPCTAADDTDGVITATVKGPTYTIICTYRGNAPGEGPACTQQ